jgi:hypothetical protein
MRRKHSASLTYFVKEESLFHLTKLEFLNPAFFVLIYFYIPVIFH